MCHVVFLCCTTYDRCDFRVFRLSTCFVCVPSRLLSCTERCLEQPYRPYKSGGRWSWASTLFCCFRLLLMMTRRAPVGCNHDLCVCRVVKSMRSAPSCTKYRTYVRVPTSVFDLAACFIVFLSFYVCERTPRACVSAVAGTFNSRVDVSCCVGPRRKTGTSFGLIVCLLVVAGRWWRS